MPPSIQAAGKSPDFRAGSPGVQAGAEGAPLFLTLADPVPAGLDVIFRVTSCARHPTQEQDMRMAQAACVCRLVRNHAFDQRRNPWRNTRARTGDTLNVVTQCRKPTRSRAKFGFVREVNQTAAQRMLKALDAACRRARKGLCR